MPGFTFPAVGPVGLGSPPFRSAPPWRAIGTTFR